MNVWRGVAPFLVVAVEVELGVQLTCLVYDKARLRVLVAVEVELEVQLTCLVYDKARVP
jgi:hypothetical protein